MYKDDNTQGYALRVLNYYQTYLNTSINSKSTISKSSNLPKAYNRFTNVIGNLELQ